MIGRRALNSRFSRRPHNNCNYTNAFCGRIILVVVLFSFVLYQKSWESSLTKIDDHLSDSSSISSKKLRSSISSDVALLPVISSVDTQKGTPTAYSGDVPDSYYDVATGVDDSELYDDAAFQRGEYDYFDVRPSTDDVSISSNGDVSTAEQKLPIERVALLGERNTGTRWMSSELSKCFPTLNVQPRLVRWKHWFQHDLPHTDGSPQETTLVIAQFRNVYDWVEAMRKVPHHAPLHLRKSWKSFVTTPWTMKRPKRDEPYKNNLFTTKNETTKEPVAPLCFEKFYYNQIISCIEGSRNDTSYEAYGCDPDKDFSCHKPNYELKHNIDMTKLSGKAYDSIIDLRRDKIINFVKELKEFPWIVDVIDVQYEKLLNDGTEFLLSKIENITGVKRHCEATPKQTRKKREINPEMIQWLNDHVDWETEGLIGYTKIEVPSEILVSKAESEEEGDKDSVQDQVGNYGSDNAEEEDDEKGQEISTSNDSSSKKGKAEEDNDNDEDDNAKDYRKLSSKRSKSISWLEG